MYANLTATVRRPMNPNHLLVFCMLMAMCLSLPHLQNSTFTWPTTSTVHAEETTTTLGDVSIPTVKMSFAAREMATAVGLTGVKTLAQPSEVPGPMLSAPVTLPHASGEISELEALDLIEFQEFNRTDVARK